MAVSTNIRLFLVTDVVHKYSNFYTWNPYRNQHFGHHLMKWMKVLGHFITFVNPNSLVSGFVSNQMFF